MESSSGTIIVSKGIQNPFTLKVGQVFTGFGVGCGLGIGVGRPINLGAIPVLNQVMVAARGASDVFSGVGRHVNHSAYRETNRDNIIVDLGINERDTGSVLGLFHSEDAYTREAIPAIQWKWRRIQISNFKSPL